MHHSLRFRVSATAITLALCVLVYSQATPQPEKGGSKAMHAKGEFEVRLSPSGTEDKAEGSTLGRMTIAKQFHGDLEAKSAGEMLTALTSVQNSAGYVAVERVSGLLGRRVGTFVLQHSSTLTRGEPHQNILVVPDSGTAELEGLAGTMTIKIENGKHFYDFEYTLPASR